MLIGTATNGVLFMELMMATLKWFIFPEMKAAI